MNDKHKSADWYEFKRKQDEYNTKQAAGSMRESAERRRYGGKTQAERYAEAMTAQRKRRMNDGTD
jgi:hypothetical protein